MQDGEMGAWEAWEMLTAIDDFGDNVTMLQLRDPPYTVVELWWESEGKLRFSYDDVGDDVMCVWAHGGTSNNSAWELEGLRQQLSQQRGLCPQPGPQPWPPSICSATGTASAGWPSGISAGCST